MFFMESGVHLVQLTDPFLANLEKDNDGDWKKPWHWVFTTPPKFSIPTQRQRWVRMDLSHPILGCGCHLFAVYDWQRIVDKAPPPLQETTSNYVRLRQITSNYDILRCRLVKLRQITSNYDILRHIPLRVLRK